MKIVIRARIISEDRGYVTLSVDSRPFADAQLRKQLDELYDCDRDIVRRAMEHLSMLSRELALVDAMRMAGNRDEPCEDNPLTNPAWADPT
jgi:hypothetical protein